MTKILFDLFFIWETFAAREAHENFLRGDVKKIRSKAEDFQLSCHNYWAFEHKFILTANLSKPLDRTVYIKFKVLSGFFLKFWKKIELIR